MAKIDFPVATADGQIFVASTNVVYTYVGNPPAGYWSGYDGSPGTLGETFVEVVGDNMTGDLTLGTNPLAPNITLKPNGTASFAGKVTSASTEASDSGTTLVTKDYLTDASGTPNGGTGDRPSSPEIGDLYFDTDLDLLLVWNGTDWEPVSPPAEPGQWQRNSTKLTPVNNGDTVAVTAADGTENITLNADGTASFADGDVNIDSSGRLLVGTTTSETINGDNVNLQIKDTGANAGLSIHRSQDNTSPPYINLAHSRAGAIVSNNDELGAINFFGHDGTDLNSIGGAINCQVDGTPGSNDMPGRLVFSTTADGASSPTERVIIDSSGHVGINTMSPKAKLQVNSGDINIVARSGSTETGIFFRNPIDTLSYAKIGYTDTTGTLVLGTTNTYPTVFITNDTERMRIDKEGDITATGNAKFAEKVQTQGDPLAAGGAETGAIVFGGSGFVAAAGNDSSALYRGYRTGETTHTFRVNVDGSATFAGNTFIGDASSTYVFCDPTGFLSVKSASASTSAAFGVTRVGESDYNATIFADGSATFAGKVDASSVQVGPGAVEIDRGIDDNSAGIAISNSTGVVGSLNCDGSATFAGTVSQNVTRSNSIEILLEADDDTKYTATTDSEGNVTTVYNGEVLDVKALLLTLQTAASRIATLEAKVQTLETDHATLMNNNGGY